MKKRNFLLFAMVIAFATIYFLKQGAIEIPHLMLRTFIRMLAAYALSLVFSVSFGLLIAHNKKAYEIFFPVLDVLQSVPILGFLPFAVLFIIHAIPVLGSELATVFLIFTSMTWAIIFNVIQAARSIPPDIKDAARLNGISGVDYLFHVLLPGIYSQVISGSITGWGGGWYFLVAGEYIGFGKAPPYVLPGIGSFITQSAYAGDIIHSLIGMGILAGMVMFMNIFVWSPLFARSSRFSYAPSEGESQAVQENTITRFISSIYARIKRLFTTLLRKQVSKAMSGVQIGPEFSFEESRKLSIYDFSLMGVVAIVFALIFIFSGKQAAELITMVIFTVKTLARIFIAYIIAVAWTVAFAIYTRRNKKLLAFFMPIFDVLQSIPAIAVFLVMVVFVIKLLGSGIGPEIASLLLLLTGMQWYLLFNIINAVQNLPGDINDASDILMLKTPDRVKHILLPAIFPALVIGSIQAFGGGWNATIISEYITYQSQTFHVDGIGYLLDLAAGNGDIAGILLTSIVIVAAIIIINKFFWRKVLKRAELYKF